MKYLPIDVTNIKETNDRFAIDINEEEFIIEIFWNKEGEFFTFNIYDNQERPILAGRKIVYGVDLLENTVDDRLPDVKIMAIDESERVKKVTLDNFGDSVLLGVINNE